MWLLPWDQDTMQTSSFRVNMKGEGSSIIKELKKKKAPEFLKCSDRKIRLSRKKTFRKRRIWGNDTGLTHGPDVLAKITTQTRGGRKVIDPMPLTGESRRLVRRVTPIERQSGGEDSGVRKWKTQNIKTATQKIVKSRQGVYK